MTLTESLLSIRVLQKCPPSWHSCLAPNQDSSVSGDVKCKKKFPQISQLQQINSNCPVVFSCGKARQVSLKSLLDRSTQPGPSSWMCKYSKTTAAPPGSSDFWKPNPGRLVPPKPGSSTQGNHQGKPGIAAAPKFLKNTLWWLRNPAWYLGRFFPDKFQSPQSQEKGPSLVSSIYLHSQGHASHEPTAQTSLSSRIKSCAGHVTSWWFDCRAFRYIEQKLDTRLKSRGFSRLFTRPWSSGRSPCFYTTPLGFLATDQGHEKWWACPTPFKTHQAKIWKG